MLLSHFPVGRKKKKVILFPNSQCKKRTEFLKWNQLHAVKNTEQLYSKLPTTPFKISGGYFSAVATGQRMKIWMKPSCYLYASSNSFFSSQIQLQKGLFCQRPVFMLYLLQYHLIAYYSSFPSS